jgi:hypothetical protein
MGHIRVEAAVVVRQRLGVGELVEDHPFAGMDI